MKAIFKTGNELSARDIELPALKTGQIRLQVEACGICGTDIHSATDKEEQFGHEIAGTVLELGAGVVDLKIGQKVVLDSATPCGKCDHCKNAQQELCTDIQSIWFVPSFGFAEQMIAPAICAIPYEGLSPEVACLQEPLGVAIDLVRLADIKTSSNVLIIGQGPIGLMATALVRRAGARRLFATGPASRPRRLELAKQFGADETFDSLQTPVSKFDYGCEIDRILVTAPPRTLPEAFEVASKGGIISYIGIAWGAGAKVTFDADAFHFKKLQLRASFASPALYGPEALRCLREGVVNGRALISHRFPLSQMQEAMDVARTDPGAVKVVVHPQQR
jgi:L-iditol 2-dehydrogenase